METAAGMAYEQIAASLHADQSKMTIGRLRCRCKQHEKAQRMLTKSRMQCMKSRTEARHRLPFPERISTRVPSPWDRLDYCKQSLDRGMSDPGIQPVLLLSTGRTRRSHERVGTELTVRGRRRSELTHLSLWTVLCIQ